MPEIYEQLHDETSLAWGAFVVFRDLGPKRTFTKVAEVMGTTSHSVGQWAKKYRWKRRVAVWEAEKDRITRETELHSIAEMKRRQIKTAIAMQAIAGNELAKLANLSGQDPEMLMLSVTEILKLIDKGASLERLNRGEPGEIVQTNTNKEVDYSQLTTPELKQLKLLIGKAKSDEN